jgi:hypothetical protein
MLVGVAAKTESSRGSCCAPSLGAGPDPLLPLLPLLQTHFATACLHHHISTATTNPR